MLSSRHHFTAIFARSLLMLLAISMLVASATFLYRQPAHAQSVATQTVNPNRPVLAFYYMWYTQPDWTLSKMSDLPASEYNSADPSTIQNQLQEAANAGITGFISSWWGINDQTDTNFSQLLSDSASLTQTTGQPFASSIYFESDSPHLQGETNMVTNLRYVIANYTNSSAYFHWQGKPVIFVWDPLGGGRTLSLWASVIKQVDPQHHIIWSAEGVDINLLSVFDGIHLYSAGYWGLLNKDMNAVDQEFSGKVASYNAAYHTDKIWAAGVMPGYNDTHIAGRKGTFIVPRNNGATYRTSWTAAMASNPSWITITSFNEWYEGSMIEPSVTYGTQYLDLTKQYAQQWHG